VPSPARGLTQPQRVETSARRLVEAAAQLITEKGWEATTAAEIGRRAGYSRAMVHARYGGKDAILDTLFRNTYEAQPAADGDGDGLRHAVGHFDRIIGLYAADREFLRAMFVLTFEAVKSTSPMRGRLQEWLTGGADNVDAGLRAGIADGSVRADVDVASATVDISTAGLGVAHHWMVFGDGYRLDHGLTSVRDRIIRDYGPRRSRRPGRTPADAPESDRIPPVSVDRRSSSRGRTPSSAASRRRESRSG
jgi:AcrR family transcriptional regulator